MPIPESMEHKGQKNCTAGKELCPGIYHHSILCDAGCCYYKVICAPDCPQCLNIAWAKWILANVDHRAHEVTDLLALKKLAEEK